MAICLTANKFLCNNFSPVSWETYESYSATKQRELPPCLFKLRILATVHRELYLCGGVLKDKLQTVAISS